jgi:CheY-like chemotaxis protein
MQEDQISCFHYPTSIVIVDDNKPFLEKIHFNIGKDILCMTYSNPEEAWNYIRHSIKQNSILKEIIGIDMSSEHYTHISSQLPLQYDVSKIYRHVYDRKRFAEISVAVVDYAMPSMSGNELCRKLKDLDSSIKIIMLTGEAEDPIAIELFNAGVIDKFLRKAQPNAEEDLKSSIIAMQNRYFQDLTYPIVQALVSDTDSSLGDPVFRRFFNKIYHDVSATSYYLIELSGSFLLMDNEGSPTFLIIKTVDELAGIADELENEGCPTELVESVRQGQLIPYFGSTQVNLHIKKGVIEKHLHEAKKLKGKKDYAYALLNELPGFSLERDKILSFNDYMTESEEM